MAIISIALAACFLIFLQHEIYRRLWSKRLEMKLSFSVNEAFEGDCIALSETLTNAKPLPLPWVAAKFQLSRHIRFIGDSGGNTSDDYSRNDLFSINIYQRIIRHHEILCSKRGYYRIKSMDLIGSDILISQRFVKRLACDAVLTVFPKPIELYDMDFLLRRVYGEVELRRFTNPDPFAFRGIREYSPGDAFRSVNFRATAKTGQLMVNVNCATVSQELIILLNVQPYGVWYDEDVVEECIRIAASAAERFIHMGLTVAVLSGGLDITAKTPLVILPGGGSGHHHTILSKLARIDLSAGFEPMSAIMDDLHGQEAVYLLVSCYDGDDMKASFERMLSDGLSVHWILPALRDIKLNAEENENISIWKFNRYTN